jgi:hypothetical protein
VLADGESLRVAAHTGDEVLHRDPDDRRHRAEHDRDAPASEGVLEPVSDEGGGQEERADPGDQATNLSRPRVRNARAEVKAADEHPTTPGMDKILRSRWGSNLLLIAASAALPAASVHS